MPQAASAHSTSATVWSLAREWRSVFWKQRYEASLVAEDDDETIGRIVDATDKEMKRIERAIASVGIAEFDEMSSVILVAKTLLEDGADSERIKALLSVLHSGVNTIRRQTDHRQAA